MMMMLQYHKLSESVSYKLQNSWLWRNDPGIFLVQTPTLLQTGKLGFSEEMRLA